MWHDCAQLQQIIQHRRPTATVSFLLSSRQSPVIQILLRYCLTEGKLTSTEKQIRLLYILMHFPAGTDLWTKMQWLTDNMLMQALTLKKSRKLEDFLQSCLATAVSLLRTKSTWLPAANPAATAQPFMYTQQPHQLQENYYFAAKDQSCIILQTDDRICSIMLAV